MVQHTSVVGLQGKVLHGSTPCPEHQLMLIIDESVGRCQRASGHRWFDSSRPALLRGSGLTFYGNLARSVWHNPSWVIVFVWSWVETLKPPTTRGLSADKTSDQRPSALFLRFWGEILPEMWYVWGMSTKQTGRDPLG